MDIAILRLKTVMKRTGLSRSTIYEWMSDGLFPASVSLGPRAVGWHQEEIESWITTRPKINQEKPGDRRER